MRTKLLLYKGEYDEAGFGKAVPFGAQFRCLYAANKRLQEDIMEKLPAGRDVVVEQTFFKAKRRIAYIDEIRKAADVIIECYVMSPGDAQWESNLKERELTGSLQGYKAQAAELEFPNAAEGIDKIYEVVDGTVKLRMDSPKPEIPEMARDELAREAFDAGWDYPPDIGHFGLLGPRTCGNCGMEKTLFWKINLNGGLPVVIEKNLSPEELITWKRIKSEPESLL